MEVSSYLFVGINVVTWWFLYLLSMEPWAAKKKLNLLWRCHQLSRPRS